MATPRLVVAGRNSAVVGALVAIATTFLPWASSGERTRSSYGIVDIVERAGVLSSSTADLSTLWYLLPVLGGALLVATAMGATRLVASTAATIGTLVAAGGTLVARSPLVAEPGSVLAIGVGVCTAGIGIYTLIMTRRDT